MKWRTPIFLKEIKMARVTSKDKVLHLGCGILPVASILVAREAKAKVVGIDNNKHAVKHAKKFVKKHGLEKLIKIEYGDGAEYPVKDFDVIFVAVNVWPIDAVLKGLASKIKSDARIICRGENDDVIYYLKKEKLTDLFKIVEKLQHPKTQSIILLKK